MAVLVPGRPFADTLRALDAPDVRLVVEGTRLVVRASRGRFALPLLEAGRYPGVPVVPPLVGRVDERPALRAFAAVAAAASKDDALPLFTGVRLHAVRDVLRLVATDRYRLAVAQLPWRGVADECDVLVPASLLGEIARQATGAGEIAVHADAD